MAEIEYDEGIMNMCSSILEEIDLKNPCNVQFKYRKE
ncbi:MAG: ATP-grasp domain-containing protein [Lachnospiraceae bacterium]|nr:ATP-grasp domain-containing protein [Lachnospiraceae bacterium]